MQKIISISLVTIGALTACGANNEYITFGMNPIYHHSEPTPQISTGGELLEVNNTKVSVKVYLGAIGEFTQNWEKDVLDLDPAIGVFKLSRVIHEADSKNETTDYIKTLNDFPNYELYPLNYQHIEGTTDGVIPKYTYSTIDRFDFGELKFNEGYVQYNIVYVEKATNEEDNSFYLYGISVGSFSFKVADGILDFNT